MRRMEETGKMRPGEGRWIMPCWLRVEGSHAGSVSMSMERQVEVEVEVANPV